MFSVRFVSVVTNRRVVERDVFLPAAPRVGEFVSLDAKWYEVRMIHYDVPSEAVVAEKREAYLKARVASAKSWGDGEAAENARQLQGTAFMWPIEEERSARNATVRVWVQPSTIQQEERA